MSRRAGRTPRPPARRVAPLSILAPTAGRAFAFSGSSETIFTPSASAGARRSRTCTGCRPAPRGRRCRAQRNVTHRWSRDAGASHGVDGLRHGTGAWMFASGAESECRASLPSALAGGLRYFHGRQNVADALHIVAEHLTLQAAAACAGARSTRRGGCTRTRAASCGSCGCMAGHLLAAEARVDHFLPVRLQQQPPALPLRSLSCPKPWQ